MFTVNIELKDLIKLVIRILLIVVCLGGTLALIYYWDKGLSVWYHEQLKMIVQYIVAWFVQHQVEFFTIFGMVAFLCIIIVILLDI